MTCPASSHARPPILLWLLLAAALAPWLLVQAAQSVNVDMAWMTIAAGRFLDGQRMSEGYYDPNPPLSMLVQIVPALLIRFLHAPLPQAVFAYSLALAALSALAVNRIVQAGGLLEAPERRLLTATWLLANTVMTGQYLGERDHYILLALFPFVLVQYAITLSRPLPAFLKNAALAAGAVFILIKPHYGLIPVLLLLHRAFAAKRRWRIVLDADFLALSAAVIAYALLIVAVFPDFLAVILPDSLAFYVAGRQAWVARLGLVLGLFCLLCASLPPLLPGKPCRFASGLFLLAALSMVPYAVQGKGFFYHAIPCMGFMTCGLALTADQVISAAARRWLPRAAGLVQPLCFFLICLCAYRIMPPNTAYPTHADYRRSNLARIVNECGAPCPFFMFNDMMEIIHPLAVYTGQVHASRFPSYWFLPKMLEMGDTQAGMAARRKYAALIADDFKKYDPKLLLIGQFDIVPGQTAPFDFGAYFSIDPRFAQSWRRFDYVGTVEIDPAFYFGGTVIGKSGEKTAFRVYRRKR